MGIPKHVRLCGRYLPVNGIKGPARLLFVIMLPRRRLSWHPAASTPSETTAAETVLDSLGTDALQEISVDTLKWRFFEMGIRVGVAVQMLFMCLLLILSENEAIVELSMLYYPLFRGVFLLSFFWSALCTHALCVETDWH